MSLDANIDPHINKHDMGVFYNNGPLKFHVPAVEVDRENLIMLIETNGGRVTDDYTGYVILRYAYPEREVYKPEWIYDSVRSGTLRNGVAYRIAPDAEGELAAIAADNAAQNDDQIALELIQQHAAAQRAQEGGLGNKNGFTKDEDLFILEEVRKNPTRRATHKLFGEIASQLERHTGNLVRYRFRNHLQKQIGYVYKTDSRGELIRDEQGRLIKTEVLPTTVKRKFTLEDDYVLCKRVSEELDRSHGSSTLPSKFFDQLEKEYPQHLRAAWRDRYRKFAKNYGVKNYVEYYESQASQGKTAEPMKDFTARRNGKEGRGKRKTPGNLCMESKEQFEFPFGSSKRARSEPENVAVAAAAAAVAAKNGGLFISDDQRHELSSLVDSSLQLDYGPQIPLINGQLLTSLALSQLMPEDILVRFFDKSFLHLTLSTVLERANDIVARGFSSNGAEELLNLLHNELGLHRSFGTELLTNCCGDLSLISKYLNLVINTGIHPPEGVSGIWTKEDDRKLLSGIKEDYDLLVAKHGEAGVKLRRSFIKNTGSE